MSPRAFLAALVALSWSAGCTLTGTSEDAGASALSLGSGSLGVIQIERQAGSDSEVAAPRALLGAAFARYHGLDGRDVIELLGGQALSPGSCAFAGDAGAAFSASEAQVELMDMGDLEIRVAGTRTLMLPRTFPDLAGLVSGAFYAEDATLGAAVADVDEYVVHTDGSDAVPAFDVAVLAPPGFAEVRVDGVDVERVDTLVRGEDLDLAWDAGDPEDRVEVDLAVDGNVLQCVARDEGTFRIPAAMLGRLQPSDDARLVLRRVRSEVFDVEGFDTARVSVANSRTVRLPIR